jgi:cell division protein FtsW
LNKLYTKFKEFLKNGNGKIDRLFLSLVIIIALYGTVMVVTSGYAYAAFRYGDALYFVKRQIIWLLIGIAAMTAGSKISPDTYKKSAPAAYVITLILLVLTLIIGFVGNGAQRWIAIGPLTIQPSEIAKLTMVMMLANYFSSNEQLACTTASKRKSFIFGTLIPCIIMVIPILLVMLQKHLSCIIILGTIGLLLIVMSGINLKYIGGFTVLGVLGVSYIAFFTDYTKDRITVWRNPEAYKLTGGWQTLQGLMAIGSGGLFGKGLGRGELKYSYVSEPANDMIFAILCEELGFVGAALAITLFALLIARGFKIALRSEDSFSRLLCLGICTKVAVQTLLNVSVVTNTIPNTGISLPFFSYGGSSLVMLFFEMGMILSVSKKARIHK